MKRKKAGQTKTPDIEVKRKAGPWGGSTIEFIADQMNDVFKTWAAEEIQRLRAKGLLEDGRLEADLIASYRADFLVKLKALNEPKKLES